MNENLLENENAMLHSKINSLERKLTLAITGLKLLISDDSDSWGIAKKTLEEIEKINYPQSEEK